jgi:transposase
VVAGDEWKTNDVQKKGGRKLNRRKEDFLYVGVDLHKETHTAVILNCWNEKLGELTFENKPSAFSKLTQKVNRLCKSKNGYETDKIPIYGLENAYGYGRSLAIWLLERGSIVKDVNPSLSYAQRKSVPMFQKSDSYDAQAVALILINMLDTLPDAVPDDAYWTLSQLMNRREHILTHSIRLKNQLHEQLCSAYPGYKKFFYEIERKTALYFWENYPSPKHLQGISAEELTEILRPLCREKTTTRAKTILETVQNDGVQERPYQSCRDEITRSIVRDLRHYQTEQEKIEQAIKEVYAIFECTLMTIPGINLITAANILAGIGNINRFPNADKLARYAGIAPVNFSSAGKGKDQAPKQGNRKLQGIFFFLAIQMIVVSKNGKPRSKAFYQYYLKKQEEGKSKKQALICISRRLINIVYGMLKNKTEYIEPTEEK